MDLTKLKAELVSGSYSTDHQLAANELNSKTIESYIDVVSGVVRAKLAAIGKLFEINEASKNSEHPLKDAALALMMTLQPSGSVDYSVEGNRVLLNVLADGFSIPSDQKEELLNLGRILLSRSEQLGLGLVKAGHVEAARRI